MNLKTTLQLGRLSLMKHRARCAKCQGKKPNVSIAHTDSGLAVVTMRGTALDDLLDAAVKAEADKKSIKH